MSLQIGYVASQASITCSILRIQADPNQQTIAGFNQTKPIQPYTMTECRTSNGVAQRTWREVWPSVRVDAGLRYNANQATSSYQALQVMLEKRYSAGVQLPPTTPGRKR